MVFAGSPMSLQTALHVAQEALAGGKHAIQFILERLGQPRLSAKAVEPEHVEEWMKRRGEELYTKVLVANMGTQAVWFTVREQLACNPERWVGLQPRPLQDWFVPNAGFVRRDETSAPGY